MADKIRRNEPCPCGSGRKNKHCCGKPEAAPETASDSHENAVARVMAWLNQHHRKAFAGALNETLDDSLEGLFDDEEQASAALQSLDEDLWQQININLAEWLLAEGDIEVKGEYRRVAELVLAPGGPLLTVAQRGWLEQLAARPLRLYDVTEVVPGVSITLCDALATEASPIVVRERAGSQTLRAGMQLGCRVMELPGQHQLSGAIYPFSMLSGRRMLEELRMLQAEDDADRQRAAAATTVDADVDVDGQGDDDPMLIGLAIFDGWLEQYLAPPPMPEIIDTSTGEPLVLTSDHYDVNDWDALIAALAAQSDVQGNRDYGWSRLREDDDGQTRARATIAAEAEGRRLSVLYRTAQLAAEGRPWFDALAGDAVKFRMQEVADPKGFLSRPGALQAPPKEGMALPAGMDPEVAADIIEKSILRSYARWADESIPVLGNKTPRQAMQTETGLERVKGLLRSYEDGEAQQAEQQGRRKISYQFLWDSLGLER